MKPDDFDGTEPRFVLEEFFHGRVEAFGVFQDRFCRVRRQFTVDIDVTWGGEELPLVEDFVYSDGETERHIWRIRKIDDHTYEGRADGVVGIAQDRSFGNALNWQYDFDLKVGDNTWRVHFDDWMFLQNDRSMINRATVSKFGITIGEAIIGFRRVDPLEAAATVDEGRLAAAR